MLLPQDCCDAGTSRARPPERCRRAARESKTTYDAGEKGRLSERAPDKVGSPEARGRPDESEQLATCSLPQPGVWLFEAPSTRYGYDVAAAREGDRSVAHCA